MDKFVTRDSLERVALADAYFHFAGLSPSERQATVDLVSAARGRQLDLRAGRVKELRPGTPIGTEVEISDGTVLEAALNDRLRMRFECEDSRAVWERPAPDSYIVFEELTVSRDRVLALRPLPASAAPHAGGAPRKYDREQILIEAAAYIDHEGLPSTLTELCAAVELALQGSVPGETQFKSILRPFYDRMKREQAR